MTIAERLRRMIDPLPDGAALTLPVGTVRDWFTDEGEPIDADEGEQTGPSAGYTVPEVAEQVGRAASTVRGWCSSGKIQGAYRLSGREWRIPRAALAEFLDAQRDGPGEGSPRGSRADLGAWRREGGDS